MSQQNINQTTLTPERERETAKARTAVMRRAEAQSVMPFTSLDDFTGDPELTADFDVDKFLRQVREDRAPSSSWRNA